MCMKVLVPRCLSTRTTSLQNLQSQQDKEIQFWAPFWRKKEICAAHKMTCQKVFLGRGQSDFKYIPAVSLRGKEGMGKEG